MRIMQPALTILPSRRWTLLGLWVALAAVAAPGSAQWNPDSAAKDRCSDQLTYLISQEAGGRVPDSGLDFNQAQLRHVSNVEIHVTGNGWYRRDPYDRGRPYEYTCVFNSRSGAVDATYRWAGPAQGPDEDVWPTRGADLPNGRVIYDGPMINVGSGKALDVVGGSKQDAADVRQWKFHGRPNQLWDVIDAGRGQFVVVNQGSDKVLDVASGINRNGADVLQFRYNGSDAQLWRIERVGGGAFQLVNVASGKCLDVQASSKEDGANVRQWKCVGSPNQAWRLSP